MYSPVVRRTPCLCPQCSPRTGSEPLVSSENPFHYKTSSLIPIYTHSIHLPSHSSPPLGTRFVSLVVKVSETCHLSCHVHLLDFTKSLQSCITPVLHSSPVSFLSGTPGVSPRTQEKDLFLSPFDNLLKKSPLVYNLHVQHFL